MRKSLGKDRSVQTLPRADVVELRISIGHQRYSNTQNIFSNNTRPTACNPGVIRFLKFFHTFKTNIVRVRVLWNTKPIRTETCAIVFGVRGEIKNLDFDKKRRTIRRVKCRRKFGGHLKSANFFRYGSSSRRHFLGRRCQRTTRSNVFITRLSCCFGIEIGFVSRSGTP